MPAEHIPCKKQHFFIQENVKCVHKFKILIQLLGDFVPSSPPGFAVDLTGRLPPPGPLVPLLTEGEGGRDARFRRSEPPLHENRTPPC